jgi:hypothetical protein
MIYGAGVVAVFSILALLYRRAYRLRDQLSLTPEDAREAREQICSNVGIALVGVASILIALLCQMVAPCLIGIAGFVYFAIGIVEWRIGKYHGRQRKLLTDTASNLRCSAPTPALYERLLVDPAAADDDVSVIEDRCLSGCDRDLRLVEHHFSACILQGADGRRRRRMTMPDLNAGAARSGWSIFDPVHA